LKAANKHKYPKYIEHIPREMLQYLRLIMLIAQPIVRHTERLIRSGAVTLLHIPKSPVAIVKAQIIPSTARVPELRIL